MMQTLVVRDERGDDALPERRNVFQIVEEVNFTFVFRCAPGANIHFTGGVFM